MKDKNIKNLIEKYESGHSSLDEEKTILDNVEESDAKANPWFKFMKRNKTQTPKQFNDQLWEKFDDKTQSRRKLIIGILSTAATVLLFASIYFGSYQQEELSYEEKAALLNEAIEMTFNHEQAIAKQDIIYEDSSIIIYVKQN